MRFLGSIAKRPAGLLIGVVAALPLVAAVGCKSQRNVTPNDVTPSFSVNRGRAPLESAIEVTYTWTVGPEYKALNDDYRAFVHFLDSRNEIIFDDDHVPVPSPRTWQAGKTYSYTRTIFVPVYPYVGEAHTVMGLYPTKGQGERVAMKGEDKGMRAYTVGKMELLPRTENIFLVYKEGWHHPETSPQNPSQERSWIKKEALVSFKNPKEDVVVYLQADTNYKAFAQPPVLTVSVGSGAGVVVPIESSDLFLKKIRFKADALGKDDYVDLRLSMSESFVPKAKGLNQDERELSLLVYHLYVGEVERLGGLPTETVVDAAPLTAAAKPALAEAKGSAAQAAAKKS